MWTKSGLKVDFLITFAIHNLIMATINFFIQTNNNPAVIYVRLRDGRNIDAKAKTKYLIDPKQWDKQKGKPKHIKDDVLKRLWNDLENFKNNLRNYYNNSDIAQIDSQWLKNFITPIIKESTPNSVVDYFDYYKKQKETQLKRQSQTKLLVVKNLIIDMQTYFKRKFLIKDVDESFTNDFIQYCKKMQYSQNYIARTFTFIKTICYDAEANGLIVSPQLKKIKIKDEKVDIIYLNFAELEKIRAVKLEEEYLDNSRDWLLISCETGQRISDFLRFNKKMIKEENHYKFINFTQTKTKVDITLPLNDKVLKIINKRGGDFPKKITEQDYNLYIKEVCNIAGFKTIEYGGIQQKIHVKSNEGKEMEVIRKVMGHFPKWQLVTSHIGRRSFASNYYGLIPTTLLMNATGHTTEKAFLKYIGKTNSTKAIELAEHFKRIIKK